MHTSFLVQEPVQGCYLLRGADMDQKKAARTAFPLSQDFQLELYYEVVDVGAKERQEGGSGGSRGEGGSSAPSSPSPPLQAEGEEQPPPPSSSSSSSSSARSPLPAAERITTEEDFNDD